MVRMGETLNAYKALMVKP